MAVVVPRVARVAHGRGARAHLPARAAPARAAYAVPLRARAAGRRHRGPLRRGRPGAPARPSATRRSWSPSSSPRLARRARRDHPAAALVVTGLAAALTLGFFGDPHREVIVARRVPAAAVAAPRAGAHVARARRGRARGRRLFIYLTHWQVYPPLEDAGHQWLALAASLVVGIAYGRVVRPLHKAVGRAVLGAR